MADDIYVPAAGPRTAKVVVVGEAPGKDEERKREPFIGYSGQILRDGLANAGIVPNRTFITNVCHYRPPYNDINRFVDVKEDKHIGGDVRVKINKKVAQGIVELYADLAGIQPNVVVPVGNIALWALCGVMNVTKRRGSILEASWDLARTRAIDDHGMLTEHFANSVSRVQGMKVIPTFHPAYVMRVYEHIPIFQTDLKRVAEEARTPEISIPERQYFINPQGPELERLWQELRSARLLSYDIEVINSRTLYCVGFACDPSWALILTSDNPERMQIINDLLTSNVPKVAQNGLFDLTFLQMYSNLFVNNYSHDTMIAVGVSYPEFPRGLDFICSIFTREPYYKDEGKNWTPQDAEDVERFLTYNGKDVCVTLEAFLAMEADELTDPGYRVTYDRIMSQIPCYADQMVNGIKVDLVEMERLRIKYVEESKEFQRVLDKVVLELLAKAFKNATERGKPKLAADLEAFIRKVAAGMGTYKGGMNVYSHTMMKKWLYEFRGFKVKKKRNKYGKMVPTADETALNELYAETGDEMLLLMLKIRGHRKRVSSYLKVKTDSTGQTYFSVQPVKTETGRSSYGKTIQGYGNNKQTIPHELRSIYIPPRGYYFAYLDLGQAEARIVAYKGGISRMIYAFEHGVDVHAQTASFILGISMDEVAEYPHRYLGKRSNHAFNYEMGPYKFWSILNNDAEETGVTISRSEAKQIRERHINVAYPELESGYWQPIREQLRKDRTLINPMDRKRVFVGRLNDDTFRKAFSHYAQSTVADVLRTGMVAAHDYLRNNWRSKYPDTRVVLEVHDAILIQFPIGAEDEILPAVMDRMRIPIDIEGQEIIIPVDAQLGENWGHYNEEHNPKGLKKYAPPA